MKSEDFPAAVGTPTPDKNDPLSIATEAVLTARARALAKPPTDPFEKGAGRATLEFRVGTTRFGVDLESVTEVIRRRRITPLPGVPRFVLGVVASRRRIVSVVDLAALFGLEASSPEEVSLVVLAGEEMEFALAATEIVTVVSLDPRDLHPSFESLRIEARPFVSGVTKDGVVVLDGRKLLTEPSLIVDEGKGENA